MATQAEVIAKAKASVQKINGNFSYLNNRIDNTISSVLKYSANCPALTVSSGEATWNITHNLNTQNVVVSLYNSSGQEQIKNVSIVSANALNVTFKTSSNVSAGSYKIVVKG